MYFTENCQLTSRAELSRCQLDGWSWATVSVSGERLDADSRITVK